MTDFDVDRRAGRYAEPLDIQLAVRIASELVADWSYDDDPHGYCHTRPVLIALIEAVRAALEGEAVGG